MRKLDIRKRIPYDGNYTTFFIKGATIEEVEAFLSSADTEIIFVDNRTSEDEMGDYIGNAIITADGVEFDIFDCLPEYAEVISAAFPGRLIIGTGGWDLYFYEVAKNGEKAVVGTDYCVDAEIEDIWDDCCNVTLTISSPDGTFEHEISFVDLSHEELSGIIG